MTIKFDWNHGQVKFRLLLQLEDWNYCDLVMLKCMVFVWKAWYVLY